MPKSPKFVRIKQDILRMIAEIPEGRVSTYGRIGSELNVMARHVAYILAMLTEDEAEGIAWYRVVGEDGLVKSTKRRPASVQKSLLAMEGITVDGDGYVIDFEMLEYTFI
jgi:methylated-DNA-protein-cysteine methyltransferase related protein